MKKHTSTSTVTSIDGRIKKGKILFNHPIQRASGQWSLSQKSLLIDSILSDKPIPPIYVEDLDDDKCTIIDGVQRISVIHEYIGNEFKISRLAEDITVDGKSYELKNKFFHQLDEELQNKIMECELTFFHLVDCTADDIEEIFFRLNNGSSLTKDQKIRIHMGPMLSQFVDEITNTELFRDKITFTGRQIKKGENQTVVLQSLMLTTNYEYKDFSAKEIDKFTVYFRDNFDSKACSVLKEAIEKLGEEIPEKNKMLKKSSAAMIINGYFHVYKNQRKSKQYIQKLYEFFETPGKQYTEHSKVSTSSKEHVDERKEYFLSFVK